MSASKKNKIQFAGTVINKPKPANKPRQIHLNYKNTPDNTEKTISIDVGKERLNPIISLYCQLYYQSYLRIIFEIGKGYITTQHLIYFMQQLYKIKENVVRTAVDEMEQMHLIACDRTNNNQVIRLKALALQFLNSQRNNRTLQKTTARAMTRTSFICEQTKRDWEKNKLSIRGSEEKLEELMLYLASYKGASPNKQLLLDIERNTDIFLRTYKVVKEQNKVILYFAVLDTGSTLNNATLIWNTGKVIRALREMLGITTFNRFFLVEFAIYTADEKRRKVVEKNLENITKNVYMHDKEVISLDTHISKHGVINLNIDRFYRYPYQGK